MARWRELKGKMLEIFIRVCSLGVRGAGCGCGVRVVSYGVQGTWYVVRVAGAVASYGCRSSENRVSSIESLV